MIKTFLTDPIIKTNMYALDTYYNDKIENAVHKFKAALKVKPNDARTLDMLSKAEKIMKYKKKW